MRIGLLDDVFGSVTLAILLQMAPIERSEKMMDAVLDLAGTRISFAGKEVVLWPRADDIAGIDPLILRKKAMLGYRAERLVKAAQYLVEHPVSLRELAGIPEEEAMKTLTAIPGIGRYSAAIIFGQSTPPIDAWSVVIMSETLREQNAGEFPGGNRADTGRTFRTMGEVELAFVCVHPQRYRQSRESVPALADTVNGQAVYPVIPSEKNVSGARCFSSPGNNICATQL